MTSGSGTGTMAHERFRGRRDDLSTLRSAARPGRGRLIVVRGPAGIGKSALLRAAVPLWRGDGARVVQVPSRSDECAVRTIVDAVRGEFEQVGDAVVAERLAALARRCADGHEPAANVAAGLGLVFDRIGRTGPTVLVADGTTAPVMVLGAARRPGCLVVASTRGDTDLLAIADQVIDLGPLPDEDLAPVLSRAAGGVLDEDVQHALRRTLGPCYGNPGTMLDLVAELRVRGRFVPVGDRLCLADRELCVSEHLHRRLDELGLALLAAVRRLGGLHLDDLPLLTELLGTDLDTGGRRLDGLVEQGLLEVTAEGALHCRFALDVPGIERVCARFARRLLDGPRRRPALLAQYVSHARPELTEAEVAWLVAQAEAAVERHPERAVRWYATALAQRDAAKAHPAALAELLRLVVATGHYELLPGLDPYDFAAELRTDLLVVALLATAHLGPVPADVRGWWFAAVDEIAEQLPAARLLRPQPVLSPAELTLLGHALLGDRVRCARAATHLRHDVPAQTIDAIINAGASGDLATVLELVLGPRYRVPAHGPAAEYQRMLVAYRRGDWTLALSTVRRLVLGNAPDSAPHQVARMIAAEICTGRGQFEAAREWLAPVPADGPFGTLRVWSEAGISLALADFPEVRRLADETLARLGGRQQIGLDRLLGRAIGASVRADDRPAALRFLAELEKRWPTNTLLLMRALVHRDLGAAERAAAVARARGHVPDQIVTCLVRVHLTPDPGAVLQEAYELAERCGSPHGTRKMLRDLVRDLGVTVSQTRERRDELSPVEARIVELLGKGYTNRRVASALGVGEKTVENHLTRLFARTGCRSRVELVAASLAGRLGPAA